MIEAKDITSIGKFQKTHALKGELNAIIDIESEFLEEGNSIIVEIDGIYVPFFSTSVRPKGTTSYLIKLDGIDNEEEAKVFVNKTIYALKSQLAPFYKIEENEIAEGDDFIGYEVFDFDTGELIGEINYIDDTTSNLLFVLQSPEGETLFIPAAEEFIMEIDEEKHCMRMRLPDGLLDINSKNNNTD